MAAANRSKNKLPARLIMPEWLETVLTVGHTIVLVLSLSLTGMAHLYCRTFPAISFLTFPRMTDRQSDRDDPQLLHSNAASAVDYGRSRGPVVPS